MQDVDMTNNYTTTNTGSSTEESSGDHHGLWQLSQSLTSDGQAIRSAAVLLPPNTAPAATDSYRIVTGNEAGRLVAFGVPTGTLDTMMPSNNTGTQHDHAVTALLSGKLSGSSMLYVTGSKDTYIRIFNDQHELQVSWKAHEKPVTSLAWVVLPAMDSNHAAESSAAATPMVLISGSWDGTAKLWKILSPNNLKASPSLIATLDGHENSVCVTALDWDPTQQRARVATGSAGIAQNNRIHGYTVRIWDISLSTGTVECIQQVANDHEGPIRDICTLNNNQSPMIATCSNDGTVRIRDGSSAITTSTLSFLTQQHPPMLLSLTCTTDEEWIVASAEDGHVVFWNLKENMGPTIIRHGQSVWNVVALPDGDVGTCCQDGIFRIFTRAPERYAPAQERNDFEQEVRDRQAKGGPTPEEIAKLPSWDQRLQHRGRSEGQVQVFNKNNIAIAAQWSETSGTWIEVGQVMGQSEDNTSGTINGVQYDHVLPIEVDQTGGGVAKLQIGYNTGENPFVAAQRFIDEYMLPQYHLNQIADYIQQRVGQQGPTIGGDAPQSSIATTGTPIANYEYLPIKGFKAFALVDKSASTTLEKMKTKILEYGKLTSNDAQILDSLMATLLTTNRYHASKISEAELNVIWKMLETFTATEVFPALDLLRLTVLHPDAASATRESFWSKVCDRVLELVSTEGLEGPPKFAVPMLSLRFLSNSFKGGAGAASAVATRIPRIVAVIKELTGSPNKLVRLSLATLLYNTTHYLYGIGQTDSFATELIPIASDILSLKSYEGDAILRILQSLGTLAMSSTGKEIANSLYLASKVEMAASPHGPDAKAAAKEVYNILQ